MDSWRQNPQSRGYNPYDWRTLAHQYNVARPNSGSQAAPGSTATPLWMQAAQKYGVNDVWLTDEQREQAMTDPNYNPFGVGAPNKYSGDDALQRYMADNPDYAEAIRQDPMFAERYNPDGSPKYAPGQQYSGRTIPPGYQWSDAQGNPLQAPDTAPMAAHLHQTVQRGRAYADMMRHNLQQFTRNQAARMGYTLA